MKSIRDTVFVVTDTETTGTSRDADRIIELAAVKVQGGKIIDTFSHLINPRRSVPRFITELTGISTGMVFNQPTAAEVLPKYLAFLGEGVLVAHNLNFDLGFLNSELMRNGLSPPANPTLCTLRLARRLLPGLRSKGLSSLIEFFGLHVKNRHRALGDAEATAEVLIRFLSRFEFEYGMDSVAELLTFQNRKYREPKYEPKHLARIRSEVLGRLPDRPGVYFMLNARGDVLYIGKAKSLAARVRSYFSGIEGHSPHIRKLLDEVRDVRWSETGSELNALLLESRLIKERQPPFNRALKRYRNRPFIRLDATEAYPRVSWTSYLKNDGAEYFGPVGGRGWAEQLVEIINRFFLLRECDDDTFSRSSQCVYESLDRCAAPCHGGDGAASYGDEVQRVRDFLTGRDRSVLARLEEEMKAASARLDFEEAARFRNWVQGLDVLFGKQRGVAASVLEHNAVLVLPGAGENMAQIFIVRFGRLVETLTLARNPSDDEIRGLRGSLLSHFDAGGAYPERYLKQEVEEVRLLAHWMYVYRDEAQQILWSPAVPFDAFFERVLRGLERPFIEAGDEEV